jgi:ankyrin repeat protein
VNLSRWFAVNIAPRKDIELLIACFNSQLDEVQRLLADGANPNASYRGWTPLHLSAARNDIAIMNALLDFAADPRLKNKDGQTPRDIANSEGHFQISILLNAAESKARTSSRVAVPEGAAAFRPM